MTNEDVLQNLDAMLQLLDKGIFWLDRSYQICQKIGIKSAYTEEEFDVYETLTSRFARVSDIILQKIFRSIDKVELEEGGSLIDVVNRAHKRGLIETVDEIRELRDLRNHIAHEYADEELLQTFEDVLHRTPVLFRIAESIRYYVKRFDGIDS